MGEEIPTADVLCWVGAHEDRCADGWFDWKSRAEMKDQLVGRSCLRQVSAGSR